MGWRALEGFSLVDTLDLVCLPLVCLSGAIENFLEALYLAFPPVWEERGACSSISD